MSFYKFNESHARTIEESIPAFVKAAQLAKVNLVIWSQFFPLDLDDDDFLPNAPQGEDKGDAPQGEDKGKFQGEDKQEDYQAKPHDPFLQNVSAQTESEVRKRYRSWLGTNGMCQGLSIEFLVLASTDIDNSVSDFYSKMTARSLRSKPADDSGVYVKSETGSRVLTRSEFGNTIGTPKEAGEQKIREEMEKFGLKYMLQEKFSRESLWWWRDLSGFADFISTKHYYYLISTGTHKMACASAGALIIFFDPNTGFVTCQTPKQLKNFCLTYFKDGRIVSNLTFDLTVERFKKM
jgi:hypothetical protein